VAPDGPRVRWGAVALYVVCACAFSWPFFWWRDVLGWSGFPAPPTVGTFLIMWGPAVGAGLCAFAFRATHVRTVKLFGTDVKRSLLFWAAPTIALLALDAPRGMGAIGAALLDVATGSVLVLGEELGWRGFLQDALRPLGAATRYTIVGVIWELWHFTTRYHDHTPVQQVFVSASFLLVTIALAFAIGWSVDRSRSLLVAVAIHAGVDQVALAPDATKLVAAGIGLAVWAWVLATWRAPTGEPSDATDAEPA
jgi:membrane protease YdiL (CAAX protease family)